MRTTDKKKISSVITKRYLWQMLIYIGGATVLIPLLAFVFYLLVTNITWQPDNIFYIIFKRLQSNFVLFLAVAWSVCLILIVILQFGKISRALLALTETIADISLNEDAPVSLPKELRELEIVLLSVQNQVERNKRIAAEAEQRKNDMVVYLAHDLKTPLTSIIGYISLLRDEKNLDGDTQGRYLSIVAEKADRLESLINEFFDITRFSLSDLALEMSDINFSRMLEQISYEFKPMLENKNLSCNLRLEKNLKVYADADKLERVIDNLIRNAINYSYPNTEIEIEAWQREGKLHFAVKNKGDNISEDKLARIFEQFFRIDSSRGTKEGGSGLGLAIAKEIVVKHGGYIAASSENSEIIFEVVLPMLKQEEEKAFYIAK